MKPFGHGHRKGWGMLLSIILLLSISNIDVAEAKKKHKRVKAGTVYNEHDPVHVVVNKVGPFNNPTETYRYYSLPFCQTHHVEPGEGDDGAAPDKSVQGDRVGAERHHQRLGESIVGDRRETSPYEITFQDDVTYRVLCNTKLTHEDVSKFREAIHNNWFFEMFVEDLPMWGYVGEIEGEDMILGEDEGSQTLLYPHLHFRLGMNERNIVAVTVTTEEKYWVAIPSDSLTPVDVQFSYSVEWYEEKDLLWKKRMSKYVENRFLPASFEIHWLSIVNSIVLVLLLTAFLVIIFIRVLKDDLSRYMDIEVDEDEAGWKLIHGDVFRFPQFPIVFCAGTGTGLQLTASAFVIFALALTNTISTTRRGSILSSCVITYCLLSIVGGYSSVRLYQQMNGKQWVRCILTTASLFPGPLFVIFSYVNTTAVLHGSTSALPVGTIFTIIGLFLFLSLPLTVVGGIFAKNYASPDFGAPTRTTKVAREIPTEIPWYRSSKVQLLVVSGLLPFSAIYIELNYIFASMWGHQIYTLFGILFLAFSLLLIVTSFISITLLYFQLAREDHRWWWVTFFNGGAVGITIFFYSFIFFFHRSEMNGMLQGSFFFGYMAIVSYAFFLMLGSTSFFSCLAFVKYIYSRVKVD